NHPHWVRDVTFDEDRSQIRCGNMPQGMAVLRNAVIGLMRWAGHINMAAACRRFVAPTDVSPRTDRCCTGKLYDSGVRRERSWKKAPYRWLWPGEVGISSRLHTD